MVCRTAECNLQFHTLEPIISRPKTPIQSLQRFLEYTINRNTRQSGRQVSWQTSRDSKPPGNALKTRRHPQLNPKGTESRQKAEKKNDPSEIHKFNQRNEEHDKTPSNQTFFDVKKTTLISIPARGACKHKQNISCREKDIAANHPSKR